MTTRHNVEARPLTGAGSSREVNYYAVYQFLAPHLGDPSVIPGTPVWADLPDSDPAKWQAVLWAAMWWSVTEDARQDAIADAGVQIAGAEDWAVVAQQHLRRHEIDTLRKAG